MVSSGWCVVIKLTARDRDFYTLGICVQLKNFWSGSYMITAMFATSEKMNWEVEDKWLEPIEKTWSPYVLYSNLPCRLSALCACVLSCFSHAQFLVTLCRVSARLLCPWDSPGKNTEVGCHALLQGIFPTQESNLSLLYLLHWQVFLFLFSFFATSAISQQSFACLTAAYYQVPGGGGQCCCFVLRVSVLWSSDLSDSCFQPHFQGYFSSARTASLLC